MRLARILGLVTAAAGTALGLVTMTAGTAAAAGAAVDAELGPKSGEIWAATAETVAAGTMSGNSDLARVGAGADAGAGASAMELPALPAPLFDVTFSGTDGRVGGVGRGGSREGGISSGGATTHTVNIISKKTTVTTTAMMSNSVSEKLSRKLLSRRSKPPMENGVLPRVGSLLAFMS